MNPTAAPMLACGSMNFGPGFYVLVYSVLAIWIAGAVLDIANLCLLLKFSKSKASTDFKMINFGVFFFYNVVAVLLLSGTLNDVINEMLNLGSWLLFLLPFGLPVLVISHFVFLMRARRRLRSQGQPGDLNAR